MSRPYVTILYYLHITALVSLFWEPLNYTVSFDSLHHLRRFFKHLQDTTALQAIAYLSYVDLFYDTHYFYTFGGFVI